MELLGPMIVALIWVVAFAEFCSAVTDRSDFLTKAPVLDLVVSLFTWIPLLLGGLAEGWAGVGGVFIGQFAGLQTWCIFHSLRTGYKGPKIRHALDRIVGVTRNHLGLWLTIPALPLFLLLRVVELLSYPTLVWTLGFPRLRSSEWVTVSRHKFEGLVGHDLVWCLYCDWMTGVYSMGAEMLRNVESFWCPIRFYDGKKCENCRIDFPDIDVWVPPDGTMKDVTNLLLEKYPPGSDEPRAWFGAECRKGGCDSCGPEDKEK